MVFFRKVKQQCSNYIIFIFIFLDIFLKSHRIQWEDEVMEYSGTPYIVLAFKIFDCHHGFDRNVAAKTKLKEAKKNNVGYFLKLFIKTYLKHYTL